LEYRFTADAGLQLYKHLLQGKATKLLPPLVRLGLLPLSTVAELGLRLRMLPDQVFT
jgi:hypothetical protein